MEFNFKKFIQDNKLGPYSKNQSKKQRLNENIGGYLDLNPLKEEMEEDYTGVQVPKFPDTPGEENPAEMGDEEFGFDQDVDSHLASLKKSVDMLLDMGMEPVEVVDFVEKFVTFSLRMAGETTEQNLF
jgi:hypothetical protein